MRSWGWLFGLVATLSLATPSVCTAGAPAKAAAKKPTKATKPEDAASLHAKARARMQNLDYEQALPLLQQALAMPDLQPSRKVELLIDVGISDVNLARNDDARRAFEDALATDPNAILPAGTSPKIKSLFQSVKEAKFAPPPPPTPKPVEVKPEPPPVVTVAPPPPTEPMVATKMKPESRNLALPIILGIVAVGAAGAGVGTGIVSQDAAKDLRSGLHTTSEVESLQSKRTTMGITSIVGYSVGGAAAIGTILAIALGGPSNKPTAPVAASAVITPTGGGASVAFKF